MVLFKGNATDVSKHLGPRFRNIVQSITKKYKSDVGKCQNSVCGYRNDLEAAHVHGKGRMEIINAVYLRNLNNDGSIDLHTFEKEFKEQHYPLAETFIILCKKCHRDYDKQVKIKLSTHPIVSALKKDLLEKSEMNSGALPINLFPEDEVEFKSTLISRKRATLRTIFIDGTFVDRVWKADRFTEDSNVLRNLRSRLKYRSGIWQKNNIREVEVYV